MQTIESLLQINAKSGSERTYVMKQIYEVYVADRSGRKKENWKRFCKFCKEKKMGNSVGAQKLFKKSPFFVHESTPRNLAVKLSHIPTNDLYYILSIAKDKLNRHEPVGGFIFGSIKTESRPFEARS